MNTLCIYHKIDLDGWMSAAIVKLWHNEIEHTKDNLAFQGVQSGPENHIHFYGFNYGDKIPEDLIMEHDKVILVDISFPVEEMEKYRQKLQDKFIWIDHHISIIRDIEKRSNPFYDGLRDTNFAACELTWKYFFKGKPMPRIVELLGLYDSFRHKGTENERLVLEFQYGARSFISGYNEAYDYLTQTYNSVMGRDSNVKFIDYIATLGAGIYSYLCKEAVSVIKNGFELNLENEVEGEKMYRFLCVNKDRFNPSNFNIDYHDKDFDGVICFALYGDTWAFSIYNENGKVDCSKIAKRYGGGGHKGAAGFRMNQEEFYKFMGK